MKIYAPALLRTEDMRTEGPPVFFLCLGDRLRDRDMYRPFDSDRDRDRERDSDRDRVMNRPLESMERRSTDLPDLDLVPGVNILPGLRFPPSTVCMKADFISPFFFTFLHPVRPPPHPFIL